jgi:hypothetical protein
MAHQSEDFGKTLLMSFSQARSGNRVNAQLARILFTSISFEAGTERNASTNVSVWIL